MSKQISSPTSIDVLPLGEARLGFVGQIEAVTATPGMHDLDAAELECRLVELGFIEGGRVEIRHEGAFSRDPIAIRVQDVTVALRRREAMAILVRPL